MPVIMIRALVVKFRQALGRKKRRYKILAAMYQGRCR